MSSAPATGTTALTNIINSEVIEQMIADYAIDANVIAPLVSYRSLAGKASKVATFVRYDKDSASAITELTGITNDTAMATSENTITVGVAGILREYTDLVAETTTLGPAGIYARVIADGTALCQEKREDDLAALFISATGTTIGSTGVDLSLANFLEAIARLRTAKARGKYVAVLDDQAAYDLQQAVAAATGAVWGSNNVQNTVLNSRSDGYVGNLSGVDIWYTNLTDTTNTAADVVSSMWVDAASNDEHCAYAMVELWAPKVRERVDPSQPSLEVSVTHAFGTGVKRAALALPIVTDA